MRTLRGYEFLLVAPLVLAVGPGCITLKADHDELVQEVAKLRKQVAEQDAQTKDTIEKSQELNGQLETKLAELEEVLRRNQADLGLRVDDLELETRELRGAAENADYIASAVQSEIKEVRGDLDLRLKTLEEKLNEATNIPENKEDLFAEAERQLKKRNYKGSRRLWRTFESRYPDDKRLAEVKFNVGLTYFSERDYKAALGEFYSITQQYPKADITNDALYYSGLSFAKLGQCQNAIIYFETLRKRRKAPAPYKKKAAEQITILKKDTGNICIDNEKKTR